MREVPPRAVEVLSPYARDLPSLSMTPLLVLIPAFVACFLLWWRSPAFVLVRLYLPCLMLIPLYLRFPISGFLVDVTVGISLLLAVAGWRHAGHTLRLSVLDVCVALDCLIVFLADAQYGSYRIGFYSTLQELCACALPYLIGRTLIEQTGSRVQVAKTVVLCLLLVAILSTYEYKAISDPFQNIVESIMREPSGWHRQVRWGFSRVAGPYAHAIFAGMVFSIGLMFQLWLAATGKWPRSPGRKAGYITFGVLAGLFMTQSRGPWIGCILGLIAASPGFFKNRKRAVTLALVGLTLAVLVTGVFLNTYTQARADANEDQQNAEYRRELWDTYLPMVQIGGVFGLGSGHKLSDGSVGWSDKQRSIDNEYLLRAVRVGYLGVTVFVAIVALALLHLIRLCRSFRAREDIVLAFCLLGTVSAAAFTLTTAALSQPVAILLFLTLGWSQSLRPTIRSTPAGAAIAQKPFVFERVFV